MKKWYTLWMDGTGRKRYQPTLPDGERLYEDSWRYTSISEVWVDPRETASYHIPVILPFRFWAERLARKEYRSRVRKKERMFWEVSS